MCAPTNKTDAVDDVGLSNQQPLEQAVAPWRGRPLVEGASTMKTFFLMIYCHFSIALLCMNVLFDLVIFGLPAWLLYTIGLFSNRLYLKVTTWIINFTTPVVFFQPMMLSGTKIYCNDANLLTECSRTDSLLLANHGSRIDWMVGMFCGFSRYFAGQTCERIRVGFVCEAILGIMPVVGWYRKLVANDIFVWRSFKQDAQTITNNIETFHKAETNRMLFLSPEGVVVDFSPKDVEYIHACRTFCQEQNYKPFDYVLTPRYKGSMCLLQQTQKNSGPVVSICLAYVRDGKLLNCKLLSSGRSVPDIYTLNAGIGGSPVDIYIHLKRLNIAQDLNDPKAFMMENYKEKDELLRAWDHQTSAGTASSEAWMSQFDVIQNSYLECALYQVGHVFLMLGVAMMFDCVHMLFNFGFLLFCLVAGSHTVGWILGSTSMESIPFETCIKAVIALHERRKHSTCSNGKSS